LTILPKYLKKEQKMNRREFTRSTAAATALLAASPVVRFNHSIRRQAGIPLGAPVFEPFEDPEGWIRALGKLGYRAAYAPVTINDDEATIRAYASAARKYGIIISEVGAWNNPISPDETQRKEAFEKCVKSLQLAEQLGANCCVNVSGSRNREYWAGPHHENLTPETFDMIVEVTRRIIDEVKPVHTFFTLEAMPWAFPYSADSYLELLSAMDRDRFAVHLDPMNMITSPAIFYSNGKMIRDCFKKLGPYIRSCHAKDMTIREDIYTPHLDETRAGLGGMDYTAFLTELSKLDKIPLMIEHLKTAEEYQLAASYIRSVGAENGISM
jgi:sugar phosphate isomerase/epimerase